MTDSIIIQPRPTIGAMPLACVENVQKTIKRDGGNAVFGWLVDRREKEYVSHVAHCVWRDEDGVLWETTPTLTGLGEGYAMGEVAPTEFIEDDKVYFDDKPPGTRYYPVGGKPWPEVCRAMTRSDAAMTDNDLASCQYWTAKANTLLRKGGIRRQFTVLDRLDPEAVASAGLGY